MNNRSLHLGLLLSLSLVFIVACQVETSYEGGDAQIPIPAATAQEVNARLNLVILADLDQTTRIDVLRREDGNDSTSAYFAELFTITETNAIHTIVEALDRDIDLKPRAQCPALYTLVFHLTDGRQQEFGYACEMASPSFLRGGQAFWQGLDVITPDIFNRVIGIKLNEVGGLETPFQE